MTVLDIKERYNEGTNRHFFDCDTMRFFGDSMDSFGVEETVDSIYLYRKPTAMVNVFGTKKRVGWEFFGVWEFNEDSGDLSSVNEDVKSEIFDLV